MGLPASSRLAPCSSAGFSIPMRALSKIVFRSMLCLEMTSGPRRHVKAWCPDGSSTLSGHIENSLPGAKTERPNFSLLRFALIQLQDPDVALTKARRGFHKSNFFRCKRDMLKQESENVFSCRGRMRILLFGSTGDVLSQLVSVGNVAVVINYTDVSVGMCVGCCNL